MRISGIMQQQCIHDTQYSMLTPEKIETPGPRPASQKCLLKMLSTFWKVAQLQIRHGSTILLYRRLLWQLTRSAS